MISLVLDKCQCPFTGIKFKHGIKAWREGERVLLSAGFSATGQSQNVLKISKNVNASKIGLFKGKGDQEYNKFFTTA